MSLAIWFIFLQYYIFQTNMVVSSLNTSVVYNETLLIDPEDMGHKSPIYELDLLGKEKTIAVVLGKPKYNYAQQNIIYVPIYAIAESAVRARIGVFEIPSNKVAQIYVDREIDISRLSPPILFGAFSSPESIDKLQSNPSYFRSRPPVPPVPVVITKPGDMVEKNENADDEDEFRVVASPNRVSLEKQSALKKINTGIFTVQPEFHVPDPLPEETEKEAETLRKEEYRETTKGDWIEKRMKNNHYSIVSVESNGDCFFAVIREAFKSIGKITTVDKLRAILANELTDSAFQTKRQLFLDFDSVAKENKHIMGETKRELLKIKAQIKKNKENRVDSARLLEEAKELSARYNEAAVDMRNAETGAREYAGKMEGVDTLEKMREHIRTSEFWADSWAISTLERVLNVKLIVFQQHVFDNGDHDGVLHCGAETDETRNTIRPEYYIMTSYTGDHYTLISYKSRRIFTFPEIPYDVKMMILNKCLERNAGSFYRIQDFRDLKTRVGIDADEGAPTNYAETDENAAGDLYNPDIVFSFYSNAAKAPKPGMGDGERIPDSAKIAFVNLAKIPEWRKKLDDMWTETPLHIDHHRWASVEHYVQACKYKKGYPDIYLQFSLDSGTELSKDAKEAKTHKTVKIQDAKGALRAPKVDVDYALGRDVQERDTALRAKFADIVEMTTLLFATKNALLTHKEKRGEPAVPDMALMRLRQTLAPK